MDLLNLDLSFVPEPVLLTAWTLIKILAITLPVMGAVAYLTYAERKVIGYIQVRIGPNRVGPLGLLQPIADAVKLLTKELIIPSGASKVLFVLAPVISIVAALAAWAVVPFGPETILADIDAGLLYILALTSMGVYGVIVAGWASNSKYAFIGAMRSAAQIVSYEIAMGFALIGVLMLSGSLSLLDIVNAQQGDWGLFSWNLIPLLPLFVVYFISGVAETNRAPFDLPEAEQELVGGYHTEYSGMGFALFFLGEYAAMIAGSGVIVTLFLGGWSLPLLPDGSFPGIPGVLFGLMNIGVFFAKVIALLVLFIWVRWTLPRFRYDQLMKLGWYFFFELALVNIFIAAFIVAYVK